jgi:poly(3-hydroxybutyrate) depolymerase
MFFLTAPSPSPYPGWLPWYAWNVPDVGLPHATDVIVDVPDDVEYVPSIIGQNMGVRIDPSRIYLAGLSGDARFADV